MMIKIAKNARTRTLFQNDSHQYPDDRSIWKYVPWHRIQPPHRSGGEWRRCRGYTQRAPWSHWHTWKENSVEHWVAFRGKFQEEIELKVVFVGTILNHDLKNQMITLLNDFKNVFVWSYKDMLGFDTDIVVHVYHYAPSVGPWNKS